MLNRTSLIAQDRLAAVCVLVIEWCLVGISYVQGKRR